MNLHIDVEFVSKLLHANLYAMSLTLAETIGEIQGVLMGVAPNIF